MCILWHCAAFTLNTVRFSRMTASTVSNRENRLSSHQNAFSFVQLLVSCRQHAKNRWPLAGGAAPEGILRLEISLKHPRWLDWHSQFCAPI
jgi:hypothetical protein